MVEEAKAMKDQRKQENLFIPVNRFQPQDQRSYVAFFLYQADVTDRQTIQQINQD